MSHFVLMENSDGTVSLTKKQQVFAEVCGKVTYVNKKNRTLFTLHAEKMDRNFRCVLSYDNPFCPLREGDAIFGVAEYVKEARYGDTLNIIQPPFVVMGEDKNTIIQNFITALRGTGFGQKKAYDLLDVMIMKSGNLQGAINTLDRMASHFNYKGNADNGIIVPYTAVVKEFQMKKLLEWWYKNRNLRRLWLLGINNTEIRNANMVPEKIYETCLENPYKVFSLSLSKCDDIMNRIGKQPDSEIRKCADITRKLDEFMDRGWVGIPSGILVKMYPDIKDRVTMLRDVFDVKTEMFTAYLPYPHEVEVGLCDLVTNLIDTPRLPHALSPSEIEYTRSNISPDQKRAIEGALSENISIIKGAAGTGKTTTIKEIIHNLDRYGIHYRVVSFTGKAVARIREVIDRKEPMTMHMSLTLSKDQKDKDLFKHLIIDEASMVTSDLLYRFTQKFTHGYRITLIGDPHQLTPIGWGLMFEQMINSGIVPTYTLTTCHRTIGEDNGILLNANSIVECNESDYNGPPFDFIESDTFNIVDGDLGIVRELVKILQDQGIANNKLTIICPYNRDLTQINKICQEIYNDGNRSVRDTNGILWSLNDRVMMTENNYTINVMNGNEGKITDLTNSQIQVTFKDGSAHVFNLGGQDNNNTGNNNKSNNTGNREDEEVYSCKKVLTTNSLSHSFGVSVHRYQGSECDFVIFYVPESKPSKFLNRNLLYTGITRARRIIWMVGHYDTMLRAATTPPPYRCDNLANRLKDSRKIDI